MNKCFGINYNLRLLMGVTECVTLRQKQNFYFECIFS